MAYSPFLPSPVGTPTDPLAHPNAAPAPQTVNDWITSVNPTADVNYWGPKINAAGGLVSDMSYWQRRMTDPEGVGSNARPAAAPKTRSPYMTDPSADLSEAGPPPSDVLAQVMAELQAQQQGSDSPLTRQVHLQMLGGRHATPRG